MTKKLLILYAHPDDESFGSGGLIAKYAHEGVQVDYICATDGDMGTPDQSIRDEIVSLAALRRKELECAQSVLGLHRVILLDYKDSGMMGHVSNTTPTCLWYQWNHHSDTVLKQLVTHIRDIQPQVLVTFNRYGGYGHPDHIAIQQATTQAFYLAGNEAYITDNQSPYQPQKLYYASIPAPQYFRIYLMWLRLKGVDIQRMGVNQDLDYQAVLNHLEPIHTLIDVRDYMTIWDEASDCHISQGQGRSSGTRGMMANLPKWLRHRLASHYGLTRVHPLPNDQHIDEHDLFKNVIIN